mmetsp:Transcript_9279/g.18910  ORF Transcript_9279/g.18910 Transcript_9279/m.18910 type:complete len:217 (+) Transcript_9279:3381-4031(+)
MLRRTGLVVKRQTGRIQSTLYGSNWRGVKVAASELRAGEFVDLGGERGLAVVQKSTKAGGTGRGLSYLHLDFKDVKSGAKWSNRFRPAELLERAIVEIISVQYLYEQSDTYVFLDSSTFEQLEVSKRALGESGAFLSTNLDLKASQYEGSIVDIIFPQHLSMTVKSAERPGAQASPTNKPAILENGVRVGVPPFVSPGDRILIKLGPQGPEYVGRG